LLCLQCACITKKSKDLVEFRVVEAIIQHGDPLQERHPIRDATLRPIGAHRMERASWQTPVAATAALCQRHNHLQPRRRHITLQSSRISSSHSCCSFSASSTAASRRVQTRSAGKIGSKVGEATAAAMRKMFMGGKECSFAVYL